MRKQPIPKISPIDEKQTKIRQYFKNPQSPNLFISYEDFFKNFPINDSNFTNENLNLIDIHLRYRWYVRQKMAPYKWIPIICMTPILFRNFWFVLAIPYFTVKMFDHYFESFFVWRYKKEPIINIRNEFITKLSKDINKMRRITLFQTLKSKLQGRKQENGQAAKQGPLKYIKFGEFTQYIFHAYMDGMEQSSVLQTTIFETFLNLKYFFTGFSQFSILKDTFLSFKNDFMQYKKDSQKTKYKINLSALLDRDTIKPTEVYTLEDNIDHNIRRYSQIGKYLMTGRLDPSQFKLWQYLNISSYEDIFQKIKYNIKQNNSDLLLYYSVLAIPKLFKIIFKRR